MRLPNVEQAIVPSGKIVDYLLSETHPKGKHKAVFFLRLGFTVVSWEIMAEALSGHAADNNVVTVKTTPHCQNYVIEGRLQTPSGETPFVRSVWCIRHGESIPYFVTAYPIEEGNSDD